MSNATENEQRMNDRRDHAVDQREQRFKIEVAAERVGGDVDENAFGLVEPGGRIGSQQCHEDRELHRGDKLPANRKLPIFAGLFQSSRCRWLCYVDSCPT